MRTFLRSSAWAGITIILCGAVTAFAQSPSGTPAPAAPSAVNPITDAASPGPAAKAAEKTGDTPAPWSPVKVAFGPLQAPSRTWNIYGLAIDCLFGSAVNRMVGVQVGLVADAKELAGFQLGALGNGALSMKPGLQLGLVNQVEKGMLGVQVGLMNNGDTWAEHHRGPTVRTGAYSEQYTSYGQWNRFCPGVNGLQAACFFNTAKTLQGMQVGFMNRATEARGIQVAGLMNLFDASAAGLQVGVINGSDGATSTLHGVQAGFINDTAMVNGVQLGAFNSCTELRGVQVGLWNRCSKSWLRAIPLIRVGF